MDDPIRHVVLLMLENHSFDQMLGAMRARYPDLDGVDPSAPPRENRDDAGRAYAQLPIEALQVRPDPKHEHANALRQLEGGNAGFVKDYLAAHGEAARDACPQIMGYYPRGFLPALHPLAESFTVCDRWFASLPGPTWPNRLFALTGTSNGRVLMPEGVSHLGMLWDQTQTTLFDRLDEKGRSWRVYFYDFPVSLVLRRQRSAANLARHHPMARFFEDVARADAAREMPDFVLLEPKYLGPDQNDDHPPHNVMKAQKLVADVYDAIRANDALWESTLLVIVWDEHGGFYDHVPPPAAVPPDDRTDEWTFDRLGARVPAVLVSPWVEARVESTVFDHTSVLRYLIDKWQLAPLGRRAASANSVAVALRDTLRRDTPPFLRVPNAQLIAPFPEWEREDATAHHEGLHLVADLLDAEEAALGEAAVAAAARAQRWRESLPRAKAALGDWLIALGRSLRAPLEHAQAERVARTVDAARSKTTSG